MPKPRLTRLPLMPSRPERGQVVTVCVGGSVLDLAWDGRRWATKRVVRR